MTTTAAAEATNIGQVSRGLQVFDDLPDSAYVSVHTVAELYSVSVPTVWRWARKCVIPKPERFCNTTRWKVGPLRGSMKAAA